MPFMALPGSRLTKLMLMELGLSWQEPVEDKDLNNPPGAPANEERYIVGPAPAGAWAGHADEIAMWLDSDASWHFYTPSDGWATYVQDENLVYIYDGVGWNPLGSTSTVWQAPVIDKDLNNPPGAPADGDRYIVGPAPAGLWAGHADDIAEWDAAVALWLFTTPTEGFACWVNDENLVYAYDGAAWAPLATPLPFTVIEVGDDVAAVINAGAAGEVFWLVAGTHGALTAEIAPPANSTIIGTRSSILPYNANRGIAIATSGVTLWGFTIDPNNIACSHAMDVASGVTDTIIDGVKVTGFFGMPGAGVDLNNTTRCTIRGCEIDAVDVGIFGGTPSEIRIEDNYIDNLSSFGINATTMNHSRVSGNRIKDCGATFIQIVNSATSGIIIAENHFEVDAAGVQDGIEVDGDYGAGAPSVISDNNLHGVATGIIARGEGFVIKGNQIYEPTVRGIFVRSDYNIVSDNTIWDPGDEGIEIEAGVQYCTVTGNSIIQATAATESLILVAGGDNNVSNNTLEASAGSADPALSVTGDQNVIRGNIVRRGAGADSINVSGDDNVISENWYEDGSEADTGSGNQWLHNIKY